MVDALNVGLNHGPTLELGGQPQYRDIFDFVYRAWHHRQPGPLAVQAVEEYIAQARELFEHNKPIGQDNMGSALALRFQDGLVLPICEAQSTDMLETQTPVISISQPRGQTMAGGRSWGVTGDT